jgi:hypothetical protein
MSHPVENLVHALRDELQQYGGMLALLDQQQEMVVTRASDELLVSVGSVQAQSAAIQAARTHRESCLRAVAEAAGVSANSFEEIWPLLPDDYRPLVNALFLENNDLLIRVQQRARQNHLLLSRSLELMQGFIGTLFPGQQTPIYTGAGTKLNQPLPARPLYEAVG